MSLKVAVKRLRILLWLVRLAYQDESKKKNDDSMTSLIGKIAIVMSSSRGIERAIAERLGKEGASVVVNYAQNADKAKDVVLAIEATGGRALAVQADVSKVADIRRLFQKRVDHFGRLDIVVTNAGTFRPHPVSEVTEDDFDATFGRNAKGTFFCLQEAARRVGDGGRIINISSCGGGSPGKTYKRAAGW